MQKGIYMNTEYLEKFFRNILLGENNELKNRYTHIDYDEYIKKFGENDKSSVQIVEIMKNTPNITLLEIAEKLNRSKRAVEMQVKKLREQGIINFLDLGTVMQERNFRTIPQLVERCLNEFGADRVRIRRFLPEKAMDENIEWFFDIRNPLHPYFNEWKKVWEHPILNDPRVFKWTGDKISMRGEIPAKAKYEAMRNLMLIEDVGKKLSDKLISLGCNEIALYAIGDVCQALIKVLESDGRIRISHIYDRNSSLEIFSGYKIQKPNKQLLENEKLPILITLVARDEEMTEYVRYHGYIGKVLSLKQMLSELWSNK